MKKIGELILKFWIPLFILILGASVFLFMQIKNIKMEEGEDTWFDKNDKHLKIYKEYQEIFEMNKMTIVSYELDNIFDEKELDYMNHLISKFEELDYVEEVTALSNVDDIVGTEHGLEIYPMIENTPQDNDEINKIRERISFNPFIKGNLISENEKTTAIAIETTNFSNKIKEGDRAMNNLLLSIKNILKDEQEKTGRIFHIGGEELTDSEVNLMMEKDIMIFFPLSLLISIIILFILFRKPIAVIFPILSVILALIWTLGLKSIFKSPITPISTTLFPLITVIGIATSIHLLSQFILEMQKNINKKEAILNTIQKAGIPCFFTALTTSIGFGSLFISRVSGIKNMGIFAAVGIISSFIISMIIIPVTMRIMKFNPKKSDKRDFIHEKITLLLSKIAELNLKKPKTVLIISVIIVAVMLSGISLIKVEGSLLKYLKKNTKVRQDAEFLDEKLSGISSIDIVLYGKEDTFKNPETLKQIESFQNKFNKHNNITITYSMVDYLKLIYRALNGDDQKYYKIPEEQNIIAQSMLLYEMSGGDQTNQYITENYETARIEMRMKQMSTTERKKLLAEINASLKTKFKDMKYDVTGFEQLVNENSKNIVSTQIKSMAIAFGVILFFMMVLFGIKGGLVSIIPNIFPIAFVFGFMGFGKFKLSSGTSIIAAIAIGIVVDDTIHYFSHYRRQMKKTGDAKIAMTQSLKNVGIALISTSVVLIAGFLSFTVSQTKIITDFGILAMTAILFALIGDLFIGPILLTKFNVFKRKNSEIRNEDKLTVQFKTE